MNNYSRIYAKMDLDAIAYNMEMMKKNIKEGDADDFRHQDGWIWPWRTADRKR